MRKILLTVLAAFVVIAALGFTVSARENDNRAGSDRGASDEVRMLKEKIKKFEIDDDDLPNVENLPHRNPSLFIGPRGQARILNGTVMENSGGASSSRLIVEVWKTRLTVDASQAMVKPREGENLLAVGHKVSVQGAINADTGIVGARVIQDHSAAQARVDPICRQMSELLRRLNDLRARLGLTPVSLPTGCPTPSPTPTPTPTPSPSHSPAPTATPAVSPSPTP